MTGQSRVDGRLKVTGAARYSADYPVENLAHGYLVLATVGRGTIRSVHTSAAEQSPGVLAVYSPANPLRLYSGGETGANWLPLQDNVIRHHGQIVGLVVADTYEQARDAAALVELTYDPVPPRASFPAGMPDATLPGPIFGEPPVVDLLAEGVGSIDEALSASEVVVSGTYRQPIKSHIAMEPHATIAVWRDGYLTVYNGAQRAGTQAQTIAAAVGVDPAMVHVLSPHVGGGFGNKIVTWGYPLLAAAAARVLARPVKLVLSREQVFTVTGHRSTVMQTVALGAGRDGRLVAVKHDAYSSLSASGGAYETGPHTTARHLYRAPNIHVGQQVVTLDIPPCTQMRAPGQESGAFALETAMDELAVALGMDPIELRMRNYATVYPGRGVPYSSKHLDECYRVGAEQFGWYGRNPTPRSTVDGDWLVGTGMASAVSAAVRFAATARVRLTAAGTAEVSTATADLGTGMWTVLAMIGSASLGVPVERIHPRLGDSALPTNRGAVASAGTASAGPAVQVAAKAATDALVELAVTHERSPFHGMPDVSYQDGELTDPTGLRVPFGDLLSTVDTAGVEATGTSAPGAEQRQYAFTSFGAHFCEVAVNRWTGEPRVRRMTTVIDGGAVVNEKTARSQIIGGVIFGIGHALMEDVTLEPSTGRIANTNLADYLVPTNPDVPPIDVHLLNHPDTAFNPLGVRGIGEIGTVGAAAAVGNAVHHATGTRIRDLPITLDMLI
jgi:xanthine dehydrogenase YagR molybdenum-binding subunit